jgi:hypothetical protein
MKNFFLDQGSPPEINLSMSPTHGRSASIFSNNEATRSDGYSINIFSDKTKQMTEVVRLIQNHGFIPVELVQDEVKWFYKY